MESASGLDTYHLDGVTTFLTAINNSHGGIHIEALGRVGTITERLVARSSCHCALADVIVLIVGKLVLRVFGHVMA